MTGCKLAAGAVLFALLVTPAQSGAGPDGPPPQDARPLAAARSDGPPAITYWIHRGGKDWGPYTLDQLKTMASDGNFFREDYVWKSGGSEWRQAAELPELAFAANYVAPEAAAAPGPFYVDAAGQATGPFTLEEMTAKVRAGELAADGIVWVAGATDWARADAIEALKPLFGGEAAGPHAAAEAEADVPAAEDAAAADGAGAADADGAADAGQDAAEAVPVPPDAADQVPPPPPDEQPAVQYFVSVGGKATGPFDAAAIRDKILSGEITRSTFIWWRDGAWTKAGEVEAFKADFPLAPERPPFDCEGHLVGGWERRMLVQGQTLILQTQFDANGQFAGTQAIAGYPGVNTYGTWTAEAVGETSCSLTTNTRFPSTNATTTVFAIIDSRSMRDTTDGTVVRRIR
jgi:hypothetical protein